MNVDDAEPEGGVVEEGPVALLRLPDRPGQPDPLQPDPDLAAHGPQHLEAAGVDEAGLVGAEVHHPELADAPDERNADLRRAPRSTGVISRRLARHRELRDQAETA